MKKNYHYNQFTIIQGSLIVKIFLAVIVLLLFVFSLSGLLTSVKPEYRPSSKSVNGATSIFSGKMLFSLLAFENRYFAAAIEDTGHKDSLEKQLLKLSANISLDDPRSLLGRELPGFAHFDSEILVAGEGTDYTNMPYESAPPDDSAIAKKEVELQNVDDIDSSIDESKNTKNNLTNGKKTVLIYHTHTREAYLPYLKGVTDPNRANHSKINVTKVGELLQNSLENNGIGATANATDINARLSSKGLKYSKAYKESRLVVQEAMANNKDYAYLIDIHREATRKKHTTVAINGKAYARLAFIVGGDNAQFQKNYALAVKLHKAIQKKYPGLSRGVFKQGGPGNNGVYNQDLSQNAMLIEAGGVDNTFDELRASMDAFADVFTDFYVAENGVKEVNSVKKNSN
ncbi:stage II sporulation protein P [Bacillus sp. JJ722]|uniref:stage II sporulation protein P n=1 Tax=Bacillus sp. JJ722 TaxID=3122973 RepID=UPI002FFDD949